MRANIINTSKKDLKMSALRIWAVIPARSGSKGLPNKNIRPLAGTPLISHAIRFAHKLGIFEKILLSTDSQEYAEIGKKHGAWVPFLRSDASAKDTSMEEDVLSDLDEKLKEHGIQPPDVIVWLRPTFPFRSVEDLKSALQLLDKNIDSVRLVTEGEPRLYGLEDGYLVPLFDDYGRSMIRRQEFPTTYRVFHTDIFWYKNIYKGVNFLGNKVLALPIHKICAMDVDGIEDFEIIEALIGKDIPLIDKFSN